MTRLSMAAPLAAALALTALAPEADAGARRSRPLRTGQTTCWDPSGNVIPGAGTGQDGDLRRGEPRAYEDNGDGTIRDKRTALTWEKLSDDGSIHDTDIQYTWAEAFEKIDDLNTPPCFAGFCDWRLPSIVELQTLVSWANGDPSVPSVSAPFNTGCAPGCTVLTCSCNAVSGYWSSTSAAHKPEFAWVVGLGVGNAYSVAKTTTEATRAVRGGS